MPSHDTDHSPSPASSAVPTDVTDVAEPAHRNDTGQDFDEFARRSLQVELLRALDSGPAAPDEIAYTTAARWPGTCQVADLLAELDVMVGLGMAVRLGPPDDSALVGVSTAGHRLLAELDRIAGHDALQAIWRFAESYRFRERLRDLPASDRALIRMLGLGYTNSEIGQHLRVSQAAVAMRVTRLVRRLRVHSRNALIARIAMEAPDLVPDSSS
jgi:DNA-binding CsgD family transcriptional regulator